MVTIYQVVTKIDRDGCWDAKTEHSTLKEARKKAIAYLKDIYDRCFIYAENMAGEYWYPLYLWKDGKGRISQSTDTEFIEMMIH